MHFNRPSLYLAYTLYVERAAGLVLSSSLETPREVLSPERHLDASPASPLDHATLTTSSPTLVASTKDGSQQTATSRACSTADPDITCGHDPSLTISPLSSGRSRVLDQAASGQEMTTTSVNAGKAAQAAHLELRQLLVDTTSRNALSILFSALPSSDESALTSDASAFFSTFLAASSTPASVAASSTPSGFVSSAPVPLSSFPFLSASASIFPASSSSPSTSTSAPAIISTATHATTTTTTPSSKASSTTSTASPAAATNAPPQAGTNPAHPIDNAAVAGIASGISAAVVLGALACLYCYRRRKQQGKSLFGPRGSQRSGASDGIYPKSAWLYDPQMTPAHSRRGSHGSEAEQNLLHSRGPSGSWDPHGHARMASAEMEGDLGMPSPSFRADRASSPLLPPLPEITVSLDDGSGDSPWLSGGRRPRPMMSIDEDEEVGRAV